MKHFYLVEYWYKAEDDDSTHRVEFEDEGTAREFIILLKSSYLVSDDAISFEECIRSGTHIKSFNLKP